MTPIGPMAVGDSLQELPTNIPATVYSVAVRRTGPETYEIDGQTLDLEQAIQVIDATGDPKGFRQHLTPNDLDRRLIGLAPRSRPRSTPQRAAATATTGRSQYVTVAPNIRPNYPAKLRALSIGGAYPWAIAIGYKPIEYRTWGTAIRCVTLLHCSGSEEWDYSFEDWGITRAKSPKYAIIGAAHFSNCVQGDDGMWEHVMTDPILFEEPILGIPGSRSYWRPQRPEQIWGFNQAWAQLQQMPKAQPLIKLLT